VVQLREQRNVMADDTIARLALDPADLGGDDKQVFDWLGSHFECRPRNFCRQLRWRTSWEADVEIDGKSRGVLVRGSRGETAAYPLTLRAEAQVHNVMEKHGVLAPKVFGMIDDPLAIVMERLPGTINTANISDATKRTKVRREFIDVLARLHAIAPDEFAVTGLAIPSDAREIALSLYRPCIAIARKAFSQRPFPLIEFYARWLERHAPRTRNKSAFITGDAGQFLYDDDRLTGLIDFEVAYIGDPAAEFAGMRLRDTSEPLGDLSDLRDYYEQLTGEDIPTSAIAYHTAGFSSITGLLMWPMVFAPEPQHDLVAHLQFCVGTGRWTLQGMAETMGLALEPVPSPAANSVIPFDTAPAHLGAMLGDWETGDAALRYKLDNAGVLAQYLARCGEYGASILQADLADAEELTGKKVATRQSADEAVHAFVTEAGPDDDARLLRFFNRWLSRQAFLLKGCGSQDFLIETDLQAIRA